MKATFENEMRELEQRIRKDQCKRIETMLWTRWEMMRRVLENGRPIFEQSEKRFNKLYERRRKIYKKMETLAQIAGAINRMY